MTTRILLADDHALVRYGLRTLLELEGFEIVGESGDGNEVLRLARALNPDVVIMDLTMPGLNGIDATRAIRERLPGTQVVMLSMHADLEHIHRALAAGAVGYLLKEAANEEIIAAVRAARLGQRYLSSDLGMDDRATIQRKTGPLDRLSARERQVFQLVVEGHSSAEIAAVAHLSPASVGTYRSRLMRKLGVHDVAGLVKLAIKHGLTPPG